jgi:hypothetical protein
MAVSARAACVGGGGEGQREGIGAREANGGSAAVRGSAGGDDRLVEDKVTAGNRWYSCRRSNVQSYVSG